VSAWTDLGGGIRVRRSVLYQMNSAVLLHPEHAVVIDPGVLPSELDDLRDVVADARPAQVTLFLTHAHWDHVLGRPWWPRAGVVAHDRFAAEVARDAKAIAESATRAAHERGERFAAGFAPYRPTEAVSGLRFTRLGPWRVVFRDAAGHSDSQLTLHLPERRVLFAADMLSDIELPILDGPPARYLATLEALAPLVTHGAIDTLVPGHGAIARGDEVFARLERDIEYLVRIEEAAHDARRSDTALEQLQDAHAGMPGVERHPDVPMAEIHRENLRYAYEGAAAQSGRR
jgi:glyoxylase-like metal-dependent hydrolase (beta-lactamase superfamily II)